MNQVFIEVKGENGLPLNTDIMCAVEGFEQLGYRIRTFEYTDIWTEKYRLFYSKCPFVGGIDTMKLLFRKENVLPPPIDFPAGLSLGRHVTKMSLKSAVDYFRRGGPPVFIKPVETKLFTGAMLNNFSKISYFTPFLDQDPECWVSHEVKFLSEWRGFVHKGELVDLRHYSGNFRLQPDLSFADTLIENGPFDIAAYTVDLGVADGLSLTTVVVEFNDFWAIGSYGLEPKVYAQMLSDRYFEILAG